MANEAISSIRTVASFSGENAMAARYQSKLGIAQVAATKAGWRMAFASSMIDLTFFSMMGVGLFAGGFFVLDSRIQALADHPAPQDLYWENFDRNNFTNPYYAHHAVSEYAGFCRFPTNNTVAYVSCMCNIDWVSIKDDDHPEIKFASPNCGCSWRPDKFIDGIERPPCQSVGSTLTAFWCMLIGGFSLGMIGPALEAVSKGRRSAFYLYESIARVPTIDTGAKVPKGEKLVVQGGIEFQNVTFAYRGVDGEDRPVFRDLSLKISPGETVAFVGESGSGKSTIGKLVSRFYDPKNGTVLIDGVDAKSLNVNQLRENIGLVSQEPLLFDTTIRQNIAYGLKDYDNVTDEQVVEAAKAANAHNFITSNQFPQV